MTNQYTVVLGPNGEVISSATRTRAISTDPPQSTSGLLMRGVVLKTYLYDATEGNPVQGVGGQLREATGVYCDVLAYSSLPGRPFTLFRSCLVSQSRTGIHDGDVWIPKAATADISDETIALGPDGPLIPATLDGDHVLIGFIDDNARLPVILRALPHPAADHGETLPTDIDKLGHRIKPVSADGNASIVRHKGAFYGVNSSGKFSADTSRAYSAPEYLQGKEPAVRTGTDQEHLLKSGTRFSVRFLDNPDNPSTSQGSQVIIENDLVRILLEDGNTIRIEGKDAGATLKLGDGAVHAVIAEHMKVLWSKLEAAITAIAAHVHADAGATASPTLQSLPATVIWNPSIESSKLSFPDG